MVRELADRQVAKIPPLENGVRLTREEFEYRYDAMPNLKKAELIEGVVYIASPLRFQSHGKPHFQIITWLGLYSSQTPGVEGADNTTVRLDSDNEVQPDGLLRIDANCGGQSSISEDDYIEGAPELIVEVAASSAAYDLYDKLKVYRRNRVREYLIWQPREHQLIWHGLKSGKYLQFEANAEGIICSEVFPGLWLDVSALLSENFSKILEVLQAGLNSPEYSGFVSQLGRRKYQ